MIETKLWWIFRTNEDETSLEFISEHDTFDEAFAVWESGNVKAFNVEEKRFFNAGEMMYLHLFLSGKISSEVQIDE